MRDTARRLCLSASLVALALLPATACSPGNDSARPGIEDSLMVEVLADLHLLQGRGQLVSEPLPMAPDSVLAHHDVSREDWDRTIRYYSYHPDEYAAVYIRVVELLSRE
jgi:hypothetical protein